MRKVSHQNSRRPEVAQCSARGERNYQPTILSPTKISSNRREIQTFSNKEKLELFTIKPTLKRLKCFLSRKETKRNYPGPSGRQKNRINQNTSKQRSFPLFQSSKLHLMVEAKFVSYHFNSMYKNLLHFVFPVQLTVLHCFSVCNDSTSLLYYAHHKHTQHLSPKLLQYH